jgi:hypothetical protein
MKSILATLSRAAGALALALATATGAAATPLLIGYQGAVFDLDGLPAEGSVDVEVAVFDRASGGTALYRETHGGVALVDGTFDLQIGGGTVTRGSLDADTFAGDQTWLELSVEGDVLGPRQRLVSVPYALRAAVADRVEGELGALDVRISGSGSQLDGAPLIVENTNLTDGVATRFLSNSSWATSYMENQGSGEVLAIVGHGVGLPDATLRIENLTNADSWTGWFKGRTRFENEGTGGYGDGRLRAVEIFGNGSWSANPALYVENFSGNHGIAARFFNNSRYAATYHINRAVGVGNGAYVSGGGSTRDYAALRVDNHNTDRGMAGYFTNNSDFATAHFRNDGPGQVLYLHNDGAGHFVQGVDQNEATRFWIDGTGMAHVRALEILGGADLSERFDVAATGEVPVEPGLVVAIDPDHPGGLRVSSRAYDTAVAGIVAGAGGVEPGLLLAQQGTPLVDGAHTVALSGRVYAKADVSGGPIRPGDLLTTSERPGHAMRVTERERADGAILGKAMTGLEGGTGEVLVLVNLQ